MGIRRFCDHCGNTIHAPNRFKFGPTGGSYDDDEDEDESPRRRKTSKPSFKTVIIDLCDVCAPVWMKRVQNLTQKSDPE